MKKIYISPVNKIHQLQVFSMIATSGEKTVTDITQDTETGEGHTVTTEDGVDARSMGGSTNIWDNEW